MYRKISAIVVPTIIAAGIIIYMLYSVSDKLFIALQHLTLEYLLFGVAICLCAWWLRGWRYHSILQSLNYHITVVAATACVFVSQTANLIVPARLGDFVRVFILKHDYNTTYSEGVSSLVVERVFDIVTVALLGAVSLFFVLDAPAWVYTLVVLPLVAGVIFFGILLCIGKFSSKNRFIQIFLNLLHEIKRASLSVRSIIVLGSTSIIIWLLDIFVCVAVILMFQQNIPFAIVVLAIVIGNLVKAVPLTPGGIGTYEAALTATFFLFGVPMDIAVLISVIDHLIKNLVTLVGGVVSIYYFGDWVIPSIRTALDSKLEGGDRADR
ncbi:MAG: flippase-like domain-containing protein [Methanoregula sp.]|jgi:hypothetical protein|nr:flippase-like domain-containing protein [Methanoregula sp.]